MGEAEEVEGLRLAEPCPLPLLRRPAAELNQTGLVRMQGQRKLRQPIPQFRLEPLGIGLVLKAGNDVVGIAHQDDVSLGMVASPPLRPEIEDVMQVDVRQQGRGNAALRRPYLWPDHLPSSITPAFSHLPIRRITRRSPTRCSTKRINHSWSTASKNPAMSASNTQFTLVLPIPTASASNASCGPRPGRNPYENPRKSSS